MIVGRVMTRNPISITLGTSVSDVQELMDAQKIGKLPVLDKAGSLIGIVTRRDILKAAPSTATTLDRYEISGAMKRIKVDTIMERHVITVQEDEVVEEAARIMVDRNVNSLPVMRGALLVGIVTVKDLFKVLINAFGARRPGVRATISVDNRHGFLAQLAEAISNRGGNFVAFVTLNEDDNGRYRMTFKASDITKNNVEDILRDMQGVQIEDIRG
ncbi:MAG: CBS domain-containing protein [Spirochaetaceae bacterium]|nr:CBS domain-containing protein [Spirochaetaceae bacterium]